MIYGIPMGNKHDIDALTSDFFSAVSFTDRIGGREALGTEHPALHDVGKARQPHEVADRPGNPCRPHDHDREQDQREPKHEFVIASGPPLQPPDCFSTRKACGLLRLRCALPRINRLLEGDSIHGLKDPVKASATPAETAANRPAHPGVPEWALRARNRTRSPAMMTTIPQNWPRWTAVQSALLAYSANAAVWLLGFSRAGCRALASKESSSPTTSSVADKRSNLWSAIIDLLECGPQHGGSPGILMKNTARLLKQQES